jgi:hypothetical protein
MDGIGPLGIALKHAQTPRGGVLAIAAAVAGRVFHAVRMSK